DLDLAEVRRRGVPVVVERRPGEQQAVLLPQEEHQDADVKVDERDEPARPAAARGGGPEGGVAQQQDAGQGVHRCALRVWSMNALTSDQNVSFRTPRRILCPTPGSGRKRLGGAAAAARRWPCS